MNTQGTTPMLSLSPMSNSFPFQVKQIPLARNVKVVLGSEVTEVNVSPPRKASATNGWFAPKSPSHTNGFAGGEIPSPISPLPLSSSHSEIWWDGHQAYIRDLDSPFGTFVNDIKIKNNTLLRNGDVISLGIKISRNTNTPSYITDEHLKPVIGKVQLIGIASS